MFVGHPKHRFVGEIVDGAVHRAAVAVVVVPGAPADFAENAHRFRFILYNAVLCGQPFPHAVVSVQPRSKNFRFGRIIIGMKHVRTAVSWLRKKYALLAEKKYTTIAGTLVFFLLLSIVPLTFWLTLLFGRLNVGTESVLELPVFESVRDVLLYIREEAAQATTGASVFLVATTLYSATNLFYHMRRSGELIYSYRRKKHGLLVRLGAVLLLFAVMVIVAASAVLLAGSAFVFARLFPRWLELVADYVLLLLVAFGVVWLLNAYICPYRVKFRELLPGTAITVGAWAVALAGFAIYLKIGNMSRLYGALSAVIAFMLWLYVLMICFVSGVILNSERIYARESKTL